MHLNLFCHIDGLRAMPAENFICYHDFTEGGWVVQRAGNQLGKGVREDKAHEERRNRSDEDSMDPSREIHSTVRIDTQKDTIQVVRQTVYAHCNESKED